MFTGFILAFRIRSNFEVSYFNTTSYSVIRTLTMVVGELDTSRMGLYDDSIPNYVIYFLFIGLMCTIVLNLFVGIAVGEIKTVLDEADIQQFAMRIMFVLKVQKALLQLCDRLPFVKRFITLSHTHYIYNDSNALAQMRDKLKKFLARILSSSEHTIKLSDPQKRLEDAFAEMSRMTSDEIKSIKFGFSNQITDVELKLGNSQRRISDQLIDMSSRTNQQFVNAREQYLKLISNVMDRISQSEKNVSDSIIESSNQEFKYTNKYFNSQIEETEVKIMDITTKLQKILLDIANKHNFQFESIKVSYKLNVKPFLFKINSFFLLLIHKRNTLLHKLIK
jgi:hypothetical protein